MDIGNTKDLNDFDTEVQKYLSYFELPNMQINLKGSSQYKFLMYKSDYDVLVQVRRDRPPAETFNNLKKAIEKIEKDSNTYFIELKLQTENEKIRFYKGDTFKYSDFEAVFARMKFFKVDMIMNVSNRFYEASCVYALSHDEILTTETVVKNIKEDIEEYKAEGNWYKVLKRYFSIYMLYKNVASVEFLVQVFNSELGKVYQKVCNLSAIEILFQYYKDDRTIERINYNLKLIGEGDLNIKTIHRKNNDYMKLLNKEGKKIYSKLKDEVRYP